VFDLLTSFHYPFGIFKLLLAPAWHSGLWTRCSYFSTWIDYLLQWTIKWGYHAYL